MTLSADRTASTPPDATEATNDEDYLRRWNSSWRDTAFGRRRHLEACTRTTHRECPDGDVDRMIADSDEIVWGGAA